LKVEEVPLKLDTYLLIKKKLKFKLKLWHNPLPHIAPNSTKCQSFIFSFPCWTKAVLLHEHILCSYCWKDLFVYLFFPFRI